MTMRKIDVAAIEAAIERDAEPMLALYGHPFSSYTWKALIALYANETPFEFRMVDADHPEHVRSRPAGRPLGKFPVLADGDNLIFEATSIIEYLASHHPGGAHAGARAIPTRRSPCGCSTGCSTIT